MVRDNGTVPQQAVTTLSVNILDINDETPVFGSGMDIVNLLSPETQDTIAV